MSFFAAKKRIQRFNDPNIKIDNPKFDGYKEWINSNLNNHRPSNYVCRIIRESNGSTILDENVPNYVITNSGSLLGITRYHSRKFADRRDPLLVIQFIHDTNDLIRVVAGMFMSGVDDKGSYIEILNVIHQPGQETSQWYLPTQALQIEVGHTQ